MSYATGDNLSSSKIANIYLYTNLPTIQYATLLEKPVDAYGEAFMQVKSGNEKNNTTNLYDKWILDSGASDSLCNKRSQFLSLYQLATPHHIRLDTYTTVSTSHRGTVDISGVKVDTLYVPEFRVSLLSVPELDKLGYQLYFDNGLCSLKSQESSEQQYYPFACLIDGLYEVINTEFVGARGKGLAQAPQVEKAY